MFNRLLHTVIREPPGLQHEGNHRANEFINSRITCHTFTVILLGTEVLSIPRDFLNRLIPKWNVKNFRLEFRFNARSAWDPYLFKTAPSNAVFNVPFNTQSISNVLLEKVEVDLQYTRKMLLAMELLLEYDYYWKLDNIIANVQRNFPSNSLTVLFPKTHLLISPENMGRVAAKLIRLTEKNQQRNGIVTFKLYYQHEEGEEEEEEEVDEDEDEEGEEGEEEEEEEDEVEEVPQKISEIFNLGAHLVGEPPENCWYLEDILTIPKEIIKDAFGDVTVWYGKSFQLRNSIANRRIHFNLFYTKNYLKKFFMERDGCMMETEFLRHFKDIAN